MYISTKPVHFTDEELEMLYEILSSEFDDLAEGMDDMLDNPYIPHDFDGILGALNNIKAMMLKISDSGMFK